ncbi:MAG: hypothetical protein LBO81_04695, partial [Clostridiales Family XIII bacterium]|nr:hypothetical protein [Clostridiales Family XIII bacterium]
ATAEESAAASDQMTTQAEMLIRMMDRFVIEKSGGAQTDVFDPKEQPGDVRAVQSLHSRDTDARRAGETRTGEYWSRGYGGWDVDRFGRDDESKY